MDYTSLADKAVVERTAAALRANGVEALMVKDGAAALAAIKEFIPRGASVMNGSSRTLEQIGFVDYLKQGNHGWNNLHAVILGDKDTAKPAALRKQALLSDY
ncbi:MAG: LUD domain-containing protein, partial [bacterium]|nr:LUD domain-containing protein [bacterium]